ncbi:molybdopterin molybdotransferase MoeA [Photobacterium kishitanii]|uniref:molybdopterin molybdotransferase MoeA n=1 Tax=Photobacterium kishitanii TaxID=318456 RepID=UPI0007F8DCD0|nr:molybdopterin molybdotransferase MoeA [Photobacterium kishitanii]OBU32198.1 molybdopterin molybdenumtransferase MoeA [Photobacterium kishitanii]PSV04802.1 molybdopterin molybdotransferase [Photobacterium kishitanii]PSV77774.1 molybdopterin molybdotransferase [Photobacterium kishitanii]PSW50387.1 molybdopterin molybdotransferase [Photobacterium kishitanii]
MGCCDVPGLMTIETALDNIMTQVSPLTTITTVALADAMDMVLAEDILSPINVPPFANSAMDGYALRVADLEQSNTLTMIGKSFAGIPFTGTCEAGQCVRIMTGAEIPAGADVVIMQEETQVDGDNIQFNIKPKANDNIRPIGDDVHYGETVLVKGTRLTAREMPLLASLGIASFAVYRRPKVAFFSTGDELRPVGEALAAGQIYDSNRYGMKALLEKFGCDVLDLGIIADCPEKLRQAFITASTEADVVVTSGGVSVGEADYTKDILDQEGQIGFWKIAMKPGKPFAFGTINNAWFCGLPGNPVSAMLTLYQLVQPMLAKLAGHSQYQPPVRLQAKATSMFKKRPGRTDFQRGIYSINSDGQFEVATTGNQGSGAFSSMHHANCFVVLEQDRGRVEAGELVTIEMFNHTMY